MKKRFLLTFIMSCIFFSLVFILVGEKLLPDKKPITAVDNNGDEETQGEELDLGKDNIIEQRVKNELLFLLMGVDSKDVKKSKASRTDTLMLFKIDFDSGKTDLLSIPRDTRVSVNGKMDKINHAHYGGTSRSLNTVRDFLDLDIDYYVKVDYQAVMAIVEAIGGVKINVPRDMRWSDPTDDPPLNINIKKGEQILDGKNAHDFLRWRKDHKGGGYREGDIGRIQAQQMFMNELMKQTLQLKNLTKLLDFIKIYYQYVETNIPLNLILKGAGSMSKIEFDNINGHTIPGHGEYINDISYWIYNRKKTDDLIRELFEDYLLSD